MTRISIRKKRVRKVETFKLESLILLWLLGWQEVGKLPMSWKNETKSSDFGSGPSYKWYTDSAVGISGDSPTGSTCTPTRTKLGTRMMSFHQDGKLTCEQVRLSSWSTKQLNKAVKSEHGNGKLRQNVTVVFWNMGAKQWHRKLLEIEAVVQQYTPDLFFVAEANLLHSLEDHEKNIQGYRIVLPKTAEVQKNSRLVLLVKDGIDVKILEEYMDILLQQSG